MVFCNLYLLFYKIHRPCLIFDFVFLQFQFVSNCLPNGEYSNLLTVVALSNKSYPGKPSWPVKNSRFFDDKAEISADRLSKSSWPLFCWILLSIVLVFHQQSFYNNFFLNLNGLSDYKVVPFTKNENGSLVWFLHSFMKYLN